MKFKTLFSLHSWLGLICGLALVVIGLSGSVLVFHKEITALLEPEWILVEEIGPERQQLDSLVGQVEAQFPKYWVRGWLPRYDSPLRDQAYLKRRDANNDWFLLTVDPYSGAMAPAPRSYRQTIYGWFVELHYTFFADHLGVAITGIFALGFMALGVTGLILYRHFFQSFFQLRWGRSLRFFCSDLHRMVGILTVPMNLILGFTGAYWNISHTFHDIEHLVEQEEHDPLEHPYPGAEDQLPQLRVVAEDHWEGYSLNYLYFPTVAEPTFWFYGQTPGWNPLRSPYGSYLQIDPQSAEILYSTDLRTAGWWRKVVDAFEPLHFGDFGGLPVKILWCFAGLSPAILTLSGVYLWQRRFRRKRTLRNAVYVAETPEAAETVSMRTD